MMCRNLNNDTDSLPGGSLYLDKREGLSGKMVFKLRSP